MVCYYNKVYIKFYKLLFTLLFYMETKEQKIKKCRRCRKIKEYSCLKYCEKCMRIRIIEYKKKEKKTKQRYSKENGKEYYSRPEVKQRTKEYNKEYNQNNKEKINRYVNEYIKQRSKIDKEFNIKIRLRYQLRQVLRNYSKTGKIMSSKEYGLDYKAIIENLKPFPKDIRGYDIHHIKPLATFNFINEDGSTNLEEVKKAFEPDNLILITREEHKEIHNQRKNLFLSS